MPRKIHLLVKRKYVLLIFGMLIWISFIPLEATAPAWSYHIEGITAFAMSKNGKYILIGTQKGYFYIFDKAGNTIRSDYAKSEITSVDIAENGTFFIGTDIGCYRSTLTGQPQTDVNRNVRSLSTAISDNGKNVIAGTEKQIYLFSDLNMEKALFTCEEAQDCRENNQVKFTDISSSGNIAVAATNNVIYLYAEETEWISKECYGHGQITALALSENGQTVVCGTEKGDILVLDSQLKNVAEYEASKRIVDLIITADGTHILYGGDNNLITFLEIGGDKQWKKESMEFKSLSMSNNGLIAAAGEKIYLFNNSGKILQEIDLQKHLNNVFISKNGQYICCVSINEVIFFELYDHTCNVTKEFTYPSRKCLPLSDTLEMKKGVLDNIKTPSSIKIGDVNGDGKNEFVITSGTKIIVTDKYGKTLSEIKFEVEFQRAKLLDITGDFIPEIIVEYTNKRMDLQFYDWEGTFLGQHEFYDRWWKKPVDSCVISPLRALDIDNDEKIEVICLVSAGYYLEPRGLYTFEYPTFKDEWYIPYAPFVSTPTLIDIDHDGNLEIVLGSNAPCNGKIVKDTDDCHAYVSAIDLEEKKSWTREIGAGYKRVYVDVADLDKDGNFEIVCTGWSFDDDWGTLFLLDRNGDYVCGKDNIFDHSLFLGGVSDLDNDGNLEILTFSSDGTIIIFNYLLEVEHEKTIDINMGRFTTAVINDIDADGHKEIIVNSNDERVYILSNTLDVEKVESFPGFDKKVIVSIGNVYGCKNDLIVLSDKIYIYSHLHDKNTNTSCPLWEITYRELSTKASNSLEIAKSSYRSRNYIVSRFHYGQVLNIYKKLENEQEITKFSKIIFNLNVQIGMIFLAVCDIVLGIYLIRSWIIKKWSRLAESAFLLSLPILLGLYEVYSADKEYLHIFLRYAVPCLIGSLIIVLRHNILGFARTIAAILSGHKDMLVLSITQSDGAYRVSVESIEEKFRPVKESRKIVFPSKTKKDIIKKVDFMMGVLTHYSSADVEKSLNYIENILKETGTYIHKNFIPEDFFDILKAKFLLLEVDDPEIPWELMYSHDFFALQYAISRRIVVDESVHVCQKKIKEKRALVISDPTEMLPGAKIECEIVHNRLQHKMEAVLIEGRDATVGRVANLLGQGFDIIHFAGHVENGLGLSDGVMNPEDVKSFITGTPVVVVNGCKSEDLAREFLLGGAMAYVGTIHPVHDKAAADIVADFYDMCLQYQIGEALRRARENNMDKDIVWASLVMYGDPTLKLF